MCQNSKGDTTGVFVENAKVLRKSRRVATDCRLAFIGEDEADGEAEVMMFEPAQTRNTGNVVDETFTAPNGVVI